MANAEQIYERKIGHLDSLKADLAQEEKLRAEVVKKAHAKAGMMIGMGFMGCLA